MAKASAAFARLGRIMKSIRQSKGGKQLSALGQLDKGKLEGELVKAGRELGPSLQVMAAKTYDEAGIRKSTGTMEQAIKSNYIDAQPKRLSVRMAKGLTYPNGRSGNVYAAAMVMRKKHPNLFRLKEEDRIKLQAEWFERIKRIFRKFNIEVKD